MPTMHAAVIAAPRTLELARCAVPEPGRKQVRVRLDGSGVCTSNLPVWEGRPWFSYPMAPGAPGHEGWGVVEAVGPEVSAVAEGDRVALLSSHAYGQYDLADEASVVRTPDVLGEAACPGEPFACAVNVVERAGIRAGERVVVVGVGFLGAVVTRLAVLAGARVFALSRRPYALDLAHDLGAEIALPLGDAAAVGAMLERDTGALADCVVEASGVQGTLDIATSLTRTRGRLVIAGYHQDGTRQVDMQTWNWRGLDVINAHERDPAVYVRGMARAFALAERGELEFSRFITHVLPIERLDAAFELARTRPDGFLKAVVTCGTSA